MAAGPPIVMFRGAGQLGRYLHAALGGRAGLAEASSAGKTSGARSVSRAPRHDHNGCRLHCGPR
jgi:hypothetical protein